MSHFVDFGFFFDIIEINKRRENFMDKLVNIITDYYLRKNIIAEDKKEIYAYGFKLIFADILNFAILCILGLIFDRLLESVVFLAVLCIIRQFSGGFHAKTFWLCRLSMVITYVCVIFLTDSIWEVKGIFGIVILINTAAVLFISIFAPIEHPSKPLPDKQKTINKIKAITTSGIISVLSIVSVGFEIKLGVTISITLLAVIVLMIIGMAVKKGGKRNV